jgi:glucose/arabinose dehydrogenase/cytochrome c2
VQLKYKTLFLTMSAALFLGVFLGQHYFYMLDGTRKYLKFRIESAIIGGETYVNNVLSTQYRQRSAVQSAKLEKTSVDSSALPLLLKTLSLDSIAEFAASKTFIGGAFTKIGHNILLTDRIGNIFFLDRQALSIRKMDYPVTPNNIQELILSGRDLTRMAVVAYIAYDENESVVYLSMQSFNKHSGHSRFIISSLFINRDNLANIGGWHTIFETEDIPDAYAIHGSAGGKLLIADDKLFFSVGDFTYGQTPESAFDFIAQSPKASFGGIYEYNLLDKSLKRKSFGNRNPQGLALTSEGQLLETEQGPDGGDELNIIEDGKNYGWPFETYGTDYLKFDWPIKPPDPTTKFEKPIFAWVPDVAITPIIQVSEFSQRWKGDLIAGSLRAQSLFRLKLIGNRVVFVEPIWIGHRVRDMIEFEGEIVLMTDDPAIVFVTVDDLRLRRNSKGAIVDVDPALAKCMSCHHFGPTNPSHSAPTLTGIYDKKIASDDYMRYSDALKRQEGKWNESNLEKFLADPSGFIPGSTMPNLGLSDTDIGEVISKLKR